ncbi:hypothetical protein V8C86DRAFT_2443688, partial [Haematococcus lacustris]
MLLGLHRLNGLLLQARSYAEASILADAVLDTADELMLQQQPQPSSSNPHPHPHQQQQPLPPQLQQQPCGKASGPGPGAVAVLRMLCQVLACGEPHALLACHCLHALVASPKVLLLVSQTNPAHGSYIPLMSCLVGLLRGAHSQALEPVLKLQCLRLLQLQVLHAKVARPPDVLTSLPPASGPQLQGVLGQTK